MTTSSIEWTDKTWNPVRGCSIVSPGCVHCYAMKQAHRFSGVKQLPHGGFKAGPYFELTKQTKAGPQWTGTVVCDETKLLEPLSWRKPCRVFVNSMSDLFHEDVPDAFIDKVFAVTALAPRHTFQILTKRAGRMREYWSSDRWSIVEQAVEMASDRRGDVAGRVVREQFDSNPDLYPLPNVWLGVSCEDQPRADERISLLLQTPAAVRFVSAEPLLGPIALHESMFRCCRSEKCDESVFGLDWVIVGGESGPGARPCDVAWVRSIVQQCKSAGVACFVKQTGSHVLTRNDSLGTDRPPADPDLWPEPESGWDDGYRGNIVRIDHGYQGAPVRVLLTDRKGGDPSEWPEDLRVRQYPEAR